jgi:signal transduction histidine kinase
MTIRLRVTIWYAAVLLISFLLAGGGMYYELVVERENAQKRRQQQEPMEEEVGEVLLLYVLPALIVTVVGGWWLLRRSLAPLNQLTLAAESINAGNLQEALPRSFNGDEVDRLSEVLNAMNQRLRAAINEIHEFTLHASHELKTPLTVLHSEIETALEDPQLTPRYKESLGSQLDEIQRLTRIVEGLALLARSNSGQMNYAHEAIPFHELIRETAEDAAILGRAKNLSVKADRIVETWVLGDRDRLRQMLLNLAENAVKYNVPDGSIMISLQHDQPLAIFEISNTGIGIAKEHVADIFKKFYRAMPKGQSEPDGTGLGLSIAEAIVKAHHGAITAEAASAGTTKIRVTIPKLEEARKS